MDNDSDNPHPELFGNVFWNHGEDPECQNLLTSGATHVLHSLAKGVDDTRQFALGFSGLAPAFEFLQATMKAYLRDLTNASNPMELFTSMHYSILGVDEYKEWWEEACKRSTEEED